PRLRHAVGPPAPAGADPGEHSARLRALRQGSARRDRPRRLAARAHARRRAHFAHHALCGHQRVASVWTGAHGPLASSWVTRVTLENDKVVRNLTFVGRLTDSTTTSEPG